MKLVSNWLKPLQRDHGRIDHEKQKSRLPCAADAGRLEHMVCELDRRKQQFGFLP